MATTEGPLVLADISGYTKFMAATELEHSDVLVRRMLNTIVASLKGRLEMAQLEGDGVSSQRPAYSHSGFVQRHAPFVSGGTSLIAYRLPDSVGRTDAEAPAS